VSTLPAECAAAEDSAVERVSAGSAREQEIETQELESMYRVRRPQRGII
jgi:hypothetical protein